MKFKILTILFFIHSLLSAAIVSSFVNYEQIGTGEYPIDLNEDGINDFNFSIKNNFPQQGFTYRIVAMQPGNFIDEQVGLIGDTVGLDAIWNDTAILPVINQTRFYGLTFSINSQMHHAWVEVKLSTNKTFEIVKFAYNNEVGGMILLGQTTISSLSKLDLSNAFSIHQSNSVISLNIDAEIPSTSQITIFNLAGQLAYTSKINTTTKEIYTGCLMSGVYIVSIWNENKLLATKKVCLVN